MLTNEKGLLGFRPILLLAVFGAFIVWASYQGYIKWKGPKPSQVAEDAANDLKKSLR